MPEDEFQNHLMKVKMQRHKKFTDIPLAETGPSKKEKLIITALIGFTLLICYAIFGENLWQMLIADRSGTEKELGGTVDG